MSRPFRALLWKETLEVSRYALPALLLVSVIFYSSVSSSRLFTGDPDPARHFRWFGSITALIAAILGFWQTFRESGGDLWGFAMHRPVGRMRIFAAKPVVGIAALMIAAGVPYAMAMWWYATPGHRPVPFDRALLLPGLADLASGIAFYSAGLYAGARRSSILTRAAGIVLVLVSSVFAASVNSFAAAVGVDLGIAAVLMAASAANFATASDYDGQPMWGRVANVLSVMPAVLLAAGLTSVILQIFLPDKPREPQRFVPPPEAFITPDGRIALIHRAGRYESIGIKPTLSVTDIAGNRIAGADTALARRTGAETYQAGPVATNSSWLQYLDRPSFRDSRGWIKRILEEADGPIWYYERRQGLISIFDRETSLQIGWLGPNGYAAVGNKPTTRFPGTLRSEIETDGPRSGLLVMSAGVYRFDGVGRPQLLFTPGEGEQVIGAARTRAGAELPSPQQSWGRFTLVTTDRATYVVGLDGRIQITHQHDSSTASRMVSAVRAPNSAGAATFLWYHPRYFPKPDTANIAVEFRSTSAQPVGRYVFAGRPYEPPRETEFSGALASSRAVAMTSDGGTEMAPVSPIRFVPAYDIYSMRSEMTAVQRAKAIRTLAIAFAVCIGFAVFTWWLCRRYAFSSQRTWTWVILTMFLGPVALVTMWLLFTWPAREQCPSCGKMRVTNRERCEHCEAPFTAPDPDGTEVFAVSSRA